MGLAKRVPVPEQPGPKTRASEAIKVLSVANVVGADLKALIELTNSLIDEEFERRVALMKQSRDGKDLPVEVLRRELHKGLCRCVSAMRWLENE
jgi:hypothetical protein